MGATGGDGHIVPEENIHMGQSTPCNRRMLGRGGTRGRVEDRRVEGAREGGRRPGRLRGMSGRKWGGDGGRVGELVGGRKRRREGGGGWSEGGGRGIGWWKMASGRRRKHGVSEKGNAASKASRASVLF